MIMEAYAIVTNNPEVAKLAHALYHDEDLLKVLMRVRDMMHLGHRLISHPLAGSIKPNQTPYKSVIVSKSPQTELDTKGLQILEAAIALSTRLLEEKPLIAMPDRIKADFALIDLSLIQGGLL